MAVPRAPPRPPGPDVEGQRNPYNAALSEATASQRYVFKLKCVIWMGVGIFFLLRLNFYKVILQSPYVRHEWFKIGLALTIALLGIKAYIELYEGRMRKQKINYEQYPQITHAGIFLWLTSSVAYHIAIWPHYGWNSPVVLIVALFGVIIPFLLLVPTWLQNIVTFAGLTFFLQEYK